MAARERKKSVVLLSGGLDSAANLAFCREHDDPVLALTFRYGQKAASREAEAAAALCARYDVPHEVVELPWLGRLGGSALTQGNLIVPEIGVDRLDDARVTRETAKAVWVPNRNGIFINVAAAYAERRGAEQVVVGFNREEAATFPDNSEAFLERATAALAYSTLAKVRVFSYTSKWDKREIVARLEGLPLSFPYDKIWSCYEGGAVPCGKCESCQRYKRATQG